MEEARGTQADLGLIGIVAGVIVGPAGFVLGVIGLRRAESSRARALAITAMIVGLVQTLVVAALCWVWVTGDHRPGAAEAGGVPSQIVVGGNTVEPTFSPRPSPVFTPPATPSESEPPPFAPDTVRGGFTAEDVRPDPDAEAAGALKAVDATYSSDGDGIQLRQSEWASADDAQGFVQGLRDDAVGQLIKTGTVGVPPEGEYWLYDDEGQSTMVWTQGATVSVATGAASELQMFYIEIIVRPQS
ncbi:MAG: hypothetical protein JST25_07005 [Actinobacteria bacterium]|nr:hypothetical protein [Actinomycetota bacterium]